jgi:hypothetical protein
LKLCWLHNKSPINQTIGGIIPPKTHLTQIEPFVLIS